MGATPPGRPTSRLVVPLLAGIVVALGTLVMLGWILRQPLLVQIVPNYTAMVFATALGLASVGAALLWRARRPAGARTGPTVLAVVALGIGGATLVEYGTGASLGVDFPVLHAWFNNHPGRMAPNSALTLVLSATAILLALYGRGVLVAALTLVASFAVVLMGIVGIVGYELRPELLYGWNVNVRMALHTATGFILFGSGVWIEAYRHGPLRAYFDTRPDAKIGLIGGALLIGATAIASVSVFVALQRQTEDTLARGLRLALDDSNELIETTIERGVTSTVLITTRPIVRESLARLRTEPNHPEALRLLRDTVISFMPYGMSAVRLYDHGGREIVSSGALPKPALSVRLALPDEADLVWYDHILALRVRVEIANKGVRLGTLIAERPMPALAQLLYDVVALGDSAEMALCSQPETRIDCFPTRLQPAVFDIPYAIDGKRLPVTYALAGESGNIVTTDYRRQNVFAVYAPVGSLGLAAVLKIDTIELYRPVRAKFERTLIGLALLIAVGVVLLRVALLPLVRRVVEAEHRFRALMESAPDAMVISGVDGRIALVNLQAEQLFGYARAELIGQPIEVLQPERHRAMHIQHRRDYTHTPRVRPMGTELELYGLRKDGSEFPIEIGLSPVQTADGLMIVSAVRDISIRKNMERALADSERRYRQLVDASRGLVCTHDLTGEITYVNPAVAENLGCTIDDVVGKNLRDVLVPEVRTRFDTYLKRIVANGRDSGLMRVVTRTGDERVWTYDNSCISEPGKSPYILGHAQDITELQRARWELERANVAIREQQLFLSSIVDNLPLALFCKDASDDYRFTVWNDKSTEMFGLTREQVLGKTDYDFFPKDQADFFRGMDQQVMRQGRLDISEEPVDSKSLGRIYLHTRKVPVRDTEGNQHYLLGISEDITERKRAQEALLASEERFRILARNAPVGIFQTDPDGRCTYINEHWVAVTGYAQDVALGDGWVHAVHPDDRERLVSEWRNTTAKKTSFNSEFRFRTSEGREVWVLASAIPLNDAGGAVSGYIGTVIDISERKHVEEAIHELSLVDELTGLRNRRGFINLTEMELALARRMGRGLWLFYADLNGMKQINDSFGHAIGDMALKDTAAILRETFRETDVLARLGGDEFAVLSIEAGLATPDPIVTRLLARVAAHNQSDTRPYELSISVGTARFHPDKHSGIEQLIAEADAAMYQVKQRTGVAR